MDALTVRAATPADIPSLAPLWYEKTVLQQQADPRMQLALDAQARWTAAVSTWAADSAFAVFVVDGVETPVGYIVVAVAPNRPGLLPERIGELVDMALDAHRYHAGVGRALVGAARDWLRGQGIDQLRIQVSRRHVVEQAFWRSLGAKEWFDCLWMKS